MFLSETQLFLVRVTYNWQFELECARPLPRLLVGATVSDRGGYVKLIMHFLWYCGWFGTGLLYGEEVEVRF